jgi:hypothetical protein
MEHGILVAEARSGSTDDYDAYQIIATVASLQEAYRFAKSNVNLELSQFPGVFVERFILHTQDDNGFYTKRQLIKV